MMCKMVEISYKECKSLHQFLDEHNIMHVVNMTGMARTTIEKIITEKRSKFQRGTWEKLKQAMAGEYENRDKITTSFVKFMRWAIECPGKKLTDKQIIELWQKGNQ